MVTFLAEGTSHLYLGRHKAGSAGSAGRYRPSSYSKLSDSNQCNAMQCKAIFKAVRFEPPMQLAALHSDTVHCKCTLNTQSPLQYIPCRLHTLETSLYCRVEVQMLEDQKQSTRARNRHKPITCTICTSMETYTSIVDQKPE